MRELYMYTIRIFKLRKISYSSIICQHLIRIADYLRASTLAVDFEEVHVALSSFYWMWSATMYLSQKQTQIKREIKNKQLGISKIIMSWKNYMF